jgi:hypothetical protein
MATIGESAKAAAGGAMTPARRRRYVEIAGERFFASGAHLLFCSSQI